MKKIILTSLLTATSAFTALAQDVTIPDANFKAYLVGNSSINYSGDSEIQVSEAQSFNGGIQCYNMSINSLVGIEAFTSITSLNCGMNNLTTLDLSANTNLYTLNCGYNQLTSLDLSANLLMVDIGCGYNQLTSLDLSMHSDLTAVDCSFNLLTSLNVANGNNANVYNIYFNSINNPYLTCIEVDDAAWSTANWFNHDSGASFSEDCGALGLNENTTTPSVYPNPVQDLLFVNSDAPTSIRIINPLGETVHFQEVVQGVSTISVDQLPSGVYFFHNQCSAVKFVKE